MKIQKFEYYNAEHLIENLHRVHIKGKPDLKLYKDAEITLRENINPRDIHICQYYVLEKDLAEIDACRKALLEFGVDIFRLKGFVRVFSVNEDNGQQQVFDVLPPVVEISEEDGSIQLLCDGMHRMYLASEAGSNINVAVVKGVDSRFPYYAMPNEEGWGSLKRVSEVPDIKKNYRIKEYKTLFRDFNTAFLNVTQPRTSAVPNNLKVAGSCVTVQTA